MQLGKDIHCICWSCADLSKMPLHDIASTVSALPARDELSTVLANPFKKTLFGVSSKLPSAAGMLCFILSREAFSLPSSLPAHMPSFCHGIYQSPLIAQTAAL